jgi:hypothetical protein
MRILTQDERQALAATIREIGFPETLRLIGSLMGNDIRDDRGSNLRRAANNVAKQAQQAIEGGWAEPSDDD